MAAQRDTGTVGLAACLVRADRAVFTSKAALEPALEELPNFRREKDHAMRNANADFFHAPYGRLRQMRSTETGTRLFIYYGPRFWKLPSLRVVVIPEDVRGLRRRELEAILSAFLPYQLRIVELAIDFPWRRR